MNKEWIIMNMDICNTYCNNCCISCYKNPIFLRECGHSFCLECSEILFIHRFKEMEKQTGYMDYDYNPILRKWEMTCPLHKKWNIIEPMSLHKNMCKIKTRCDTCLYHSFLYDYE